MCDVHQLFTNFSAAPPAGPEVRNAPYVKPGDHIYNTPLDPQAEQSFRAWLQQKQVPFDPNAQVSDYDMRGFYKGLMTGHPAAVSAIDPNDNRLHYPDYWKTPLHETFSNESQWALPHAPFWNEQDQLIEPKTGNVIFDDRAQKQL